MVSEQPSDSNWCLSVLTTMSCIYIGNSDEKVCQAGHQLCDFFFFIIFHSFSAIKLLPSLCQACDPHYMAFCPFFMILPFLLFLNISFWRDASFFPGLKFLKEYKEYMKTPKRKKWSASHWEQNVGILRYRHSIAIKQNTILHIIGSSSYVRAYQKTWQWPNFISKIWQKLILLRKCSRLGIYIFLKEHFI